MAYRHYTKCVSVGNHHGKQYGQMIIAAAVVALPLILVGALSGPAAMLVALAAILAYCRWWLYDRLVCLGGDECAVGWLLKVDPPEEKSGLDRFDTDYSLNLVPGNVVEFTNQATAEKIAPFGRLIANTPAIQGAGLDWKGQEARQWANDDPTAVLHCEFEGAGVYDLMIACLAAIPVATAAAVACAIPFFGWIACAVLSLIAAVIVIVGGIVGLLDTANPTDLDENLGDLHVNDPTRRGADILFVKGTWVYDSAHDGWNEIHPIKHCQKIGTWNGSWSESPVPDGSPARWCEAVETAGSPLTVASQQEPQNQWTIHPAIDGCRPKPDDHRPDPVH
ncbi:hypothetical protein LB561_00895 [Mesorhizobium sp. B292B1B]|uniref:hypothetical protein n=1 Tax=unclassified Mesorhizobium TaxID=325217 RepID=UPI0011275B9F|nr:MULTISPECIES: hypothetical protein [unclassified Mesorhizobium]MCA0010967.1 hypothetical protein [Mesorhizobium sp. B294B1A1]MCA0035839.1 hypothetical protein [Mesorhizobium sp. B292B1B]TPM48946.1 hypothetical protein FJ964_06080 [Mesorhizobium sp. B2-3-2]